MANLRTFQQAETAPQPPKTQEMPKSQHWTSDIQASKKYIHSKYSIIQPPNRWFPTVNDLRRTLNTSCGHFKTSDVFTRDKTTLKPLDATIRGLHWHCIDPKSKPGDFTFHLKIYYYKILDFNNISFNQHRFWFSFLQLTDHRPQFLREYRQKYPQIMHFRSKTAHMNEACD